MSSSIDELLRRTEMTSKARYNAARRLERHGWAAQWTLTFLAIGQIVISLISALSLRVNFAERYIAFASVFFAVLVLAYSLLLGMMNASARAVRLHGCGLELGRLSRKLYLLREKGGVSEEEYEDLAKQYYDVLEKHENHSYTDYLLARCDYYRGRLVTESDAGFLKRIELRLDLLRAYALAAVRFSHYVASLLVMYIWIYYLVKK